MTYDLDATHRPLKDFDGGAQEDVEMVAPEAEEKSSGSCRNGHGAAAVRTATTARSTRTWMSTC